MLKSEEKTIIDTFVGKILNDGNLSHYIKSIILVGSAAQGKLKEVSDIDILVILDDTNLTKEDLDDKERVIDHMAFNISRRLSIHLYGLTEFIEYASSGHPIVYNFIKDGVVLYDIGFFKPWQNLLKKGKIRATREAIESYMNSAGERIVKAKAAKLLIITDDCYNAMLKSAQAVLMFLGREPPPPSSIVDEIKKTFVDRGLLEPYYAEWLRDIIDVRKKIEHREITEVSGNFVDEWIEKAEKFVDKMNNLLTAFELIKRKEILERSYKIMYKAIALALKELHNLPKNIGVKELEKRIGMSIEDAFKKEFIDTGRVDRYYLDILNRIKYLKKEAIDKGKLENLITDDEVYELREGVRRLIKALEKVIIQLKRI